MLDLSPTKLLIILVVGVLLAGPARLPGLARQLSGMWRRLGDTRSALDKELRATIPDLPASRDLVRYARSPVALLDRLSRLDASAGPAGGVEPRTAPGAAAQAAARGAGPSVAGPVREAMLAATSVAVTEAPELN